ncbi:malate:quinone oxidoreductase [Klebsiella pneumoniae]|nr:malate:quinone oxidoreductase [Klebsiella pneumoniae]
MQKIKIVWLAVRILSGSRKRWRLWQAGQRVQIIKRDAKGGVLRTGTEVVSDDRYRRGATRRVARASTAAPIMLQLMEKSV